MRITFLLLACFLFFNFAQAEVEGAESDKENLLNVQSEDIATQVKSFWREQKFQAAKQLIQDKLDPKSKDAQLLALLGQTEAQLNNIDLAEELLKKAVKLDAINADYQHWYATASCNKAANASMFTALGYARRCKKAYEAALELAPDHPRSYIALGSYLAQAPSVAGGDKEAALDIANRLKVLDEFQGFLLEFKFTDFQDEASFKQYLAQAEVLQHRPEPYFFRGQQLSSAEDYSGAVFYFQQALKQKAEDKDAANILMQSRYQLARNSVLLGVATPGAITELEKYIESELDVKSVEWAKYRLAQLLLLNNDIQKAKLLIEALLSSSADEELKQELEQLL